MSATDSMIKELEKAGLFSKDSDYDGMLIWKINKSIHINTLMMEVVLVDCCLVRKINNMLKYIKSTGKKVKAIDKVLKELE